MDEDLVEQVVALSGRDVVIVRPRDGETLIDDQAFEEDEYIPYWADLWPSAELLARKNRSADLAARVDAEDIVQSVFRIFFRHASRGHYDVPAGEDLWKLLLVLALNKIRSERIYHRAAKRDARLTTAVTGHAKILSAPSSQDNLATACLRIVVDEALGRLTPQQRTVVELRIDGHEVSEIAAKTNRSKRTVERLLQESRRKLRDLLPDGG